MRLIDADAFIQMMEEKCDPESTLDPWVLSVCRGGVKMIPTVDAVPVRHGRWVMMEGELAFWDERSECGKKILHRTPYYDFCPNCGADMRKDGDDEQTKKPE